MLAAFGRLAAIAVVALVLVLVAALASGCEALLKPADGCPPRATRCSPRGTAQVCSGTQRWHDDGTPPCASLGPDVACCYTRDPYGASRHACVPRSACLPEPTDAGADDATTDAAAAFTPATSTPDGGARDGS